VLPPPPPLPATVNLDITAMCALLRSQVTLRVCVPELVRARLRPRAFFASPRAALHRKRDAVLHIRPVVGERTALVKSPAARCAIDRSSRPLPYSHSLSPSGRMPRPLTGGGGGYAAGALWYRR
jgi:hypothetical protein